MNILLTGSSGFIGQNLLPKLKGHTVIRLDKRDGMDIFDPGFDNFIRMADVVIHLAAIVSVSKSFESPAETYRTNTLGVARVAELCQRHNKKLIFPSSAAVLHPELSPYAHSKLVAEELIQMIKTPYVILRLFNVYGEGMNPDSGSIMYSFLTSKKIVIFGDGEQTRDYINIDDVTDIMVASLDKKWDKRIVEVGTGQAYSANYIAGLFAHFRKKKVYYEAPKREIKWSIANTLNLKTLYDKPLKTDLRRDIEKLCTSQK